MKTVAYMHGYFAENFGFNNNVPDTSLVNKYKDSNVKELKKVLKLLKSSNKQPRRNQICIIFITRQAQISYQRHKPK